MTGFEESYYFFLVSQEKMTEKKCKNIKISYALTHPHAVRLSNVVPPVDSRCLLSVQHHLCQWPDSRFAIPSSGSHHFPDSVCVLHHHVHPAIHHEPCWLHREEDSLL